jgi:NADH-quinone oxidoreductase subunit C
MFGIIFNNKSLRTILTDYGFKSYPLMKNFPLTGFVEHYYNEAQRVILREAVELAQEYRMFVFSQVELVKNYEKG